MNMSQTTKNEKLYNIRGIRIAAFIGGPLSAFYLIGKNYYLFGDKLAAKKNLWYGLFFTMVSIALIFYLPHKLVDKIPNYILPLIYTVIIGNYAHKLQGNTIKEKLANGAQTYSFFRIMGISACSLAISILLSLMIILIPKFSVAAVEYELGLMYQEGTLVQQNDAEAIKWFNKAAARNDSDAQNNLGVSYHLGKGVPQDDVKAAQWYKKSAEQGNATAELNLGYAYLNGQGVQQDETTAIAWFRKAAEQGEAKAQYNLALALHKGIGVQQNDNEARKWALKAVAQKLPGAQDLLEQLEQGS